MKKSARFSCFLSRALLATPLIVSLATAQAQSPVSPVASTRARKVYKHQFDAALIEAIIAARHNDVVKLLKKGADPNARGNDQFQTPAICSFNQNTSLETVRALLDAGAEIESTNSQGNAPLIFAALKNRSDIITLLLQRGANIEANKFGGLTALMIAASSGSSGAVRTLLDKGAKVNARSTTNGTALIYGASNTLAGTGRLEIIKMLVAAGGDVSVKATNNKRAYDVARESKLYDVENYLININNRDNDLYGAASEAAGLSDGVFPNAWADARKALDNGSNGRWANDAGTTALILLALDVKGFDEATVKRVIAVSDINAAEYQGLTALHAAADNDNVAMVQLLIASGANFNVTSNDGRTPLDIATARYSTNSAAMLRAVGAKTSITQSTPLPEKPIEKIVPPNSLPLGPLDVLEAGGKSPLMSAAYDGEIARIEELLKQGAVIDFPNSEGHTALFFAAYGGEIKAIQTLVKAGADINFIGKDGKPPLASVAFAGEVATVRALVEAGADLKYLDSAISYAKFGNNGVVLQYLGSLRNEVNAKKDGN